MHHPPYPVHHGYRSGGMDMDMRKERVDEGGLGSGDFLGGLFPLSSFPLQSPPPEQRSRLPTT